LTGGPGRRGDQADKAGTTIPHGREIAAAVGSIKSAANRARTRQYTMKLSKCTTVFGVTWANFTAAYSEPEPSLS
jgi:hypothetical protein